MKKQQNQLGLKELLAIGIGGMIGGGIFSVLGLAVDSSGHAAPLAFLIAGLVAFAAGYSYIKLALAFHSDGASFTYLEHAFPRIPNLAGVLGWIIIVGYIGTLALYAYTFGIYTADLLGHPDSELLKSIFSSFILIGFALINLMGVRETGITEDVIVYSKIGLLVILGVIGFFTVKVGHYFPVFNKGHFSIFTSAAIIFVAFEGFQLITNSVCETYKPAVNVPRGIYFSIAIVAFVYFVLSIMSIGNLTAADFTLHGEYALAVSMSALPGRLGRILIDISAILATTSAINATLFGASRMAAEIAVEKLMPKAFSFRNMHNVPWFSLVMITLLSLILAFFVPLNVIVMFSSLTFLIVSLGVIIANLKLYKKTKCNRYIALLSFVLISLVIAMLLRHVLLLERKAFFFILIIYFLTIVAELCFSRRKIIA